ncbi:MAG: hypothetical protein IKR04_06670 [Clostridia bacterium]|nr:hypothetical protein [Clostridia bacterium]
MNNKGISLVTVIVIIIVMIIIATVSIIAGNKLILDTKNYTDSQTIEGIKEAIDRVQNEIVNSGTLTPKGEKYIGRYSPAVGNGDVKAEGWYLLDESALKELGFPSQKGRFLVNYEKSEVLDMSDPTYFEKYNIVTFLYEQRDEKDYAKANSYSFTYIGEALEDIGSDGSGLMYKFFNDAKQTELFGTGWYLVNPSDLPEKYAPHVTNSYLINYDRALYVMVTSYFERIP